MVKQLLIAVLTVLLVIAPANSSASSSNETTDFLSGLGTVFEVLGMIGIISGFVGGATGIISNSIFIEKEERPLWGWSAVGIGFGVIDSAIGGIFIGQCAKAGKPACIGVGTALLAVGIASFGVSVAALTIPEAPEKPPVARLPMVSTDGVAHGPAVSLAPFALPDGRGSTYYGVGMTVAGW